MCYVSGTIESKSRITGGICGTYTPVDKSEEQMKTESFAEALGKAFVYKEEVYLVLAFEIEAEISIKGDCNGDDEFSFADVVLLQKWILAVPDTHLVNWSTADLCKDNTLDVFDLTMMKRMLLTK